MKRSARPDDDGRAPVVPVRRRMRAVGTGVPGQGHPLQRATVAADRYASFEAFFAATWGRTVGSVFLLLGSLSEAEDVVQEAYTRAARHWERLQDYDDPEGWVRRVAWNLALSTLRRARRRASALLGGALPEPDAHSASERVIDLHRALRGLPLRYRAVLTLHYLLDMSVREVADELGLPQETVKSQLARGRRRLAEALGETTPFVDDEGAA